MTKAELIEKIMKDISNLKYSIKGSLEKHIPDLPDEGTVERIVDFVYKGEWENNYKLVDFLRKELHITKLEEKPKERCDCLKPTDGTWNDLGYDRIGLFPPLKGYKALKHCKNCRGTGFKIKPKEIEHPCYDLYDEQNGFQLLTCDDCSYLEKGGTWEDCSSGKLSGFYKPKESEDKMSNIKHEGIANIGGQAVDVYSSCPDKGEKEIKNRNRAVISLSGYLDRI